MEDNEEMKLSEDDYKMLCSQQRFGPSPPQHLLKTCWPIMPIWQKVLAITYLATIIIVYLVFVCYIPTMLVEWG